MAAAIESEAARADLPVAYLAGAIFQESRFDPRCINQNLDPAHGIAHPTFAGTDWGIAQVSGRQLPGYAGMPGLTEDQMAAKAFDPAWSIPTCASAYASLVAWGRGILVVALENNSRSVLDKIDTRHLSDKEAGWWLAAYGYNSGRHGALLDMAKPVPERIAHPDKVMRWKTEFELALKGPQGGETMTVPNPAFSDIQGHKYQQAIQICAEHGLVIGRADPNAPPGTLPKFDPDVQLLRGEFAEALARTYVAQVLPPDAIEKLRSLGLSWWEILALVQAALTFIGGVMSAPVGQPQIDPIPLVLNIAGRKGDLRLQLTWLT